MISRAPWTVGWERTARRKEVTIIIWSPSNVVCRIGSDSQDAQDDARLIAAAPELLAACQAYISAKKISSAAEYVRALSEVDRLIAEAVRKATTDDS